MFTGLVETTGTVKYLREMGDAVRLSIDCPRIASELTPGQSVSVSGACLTVISARGSAFDVEMMPETFMRTRFSALERGDRVNLERAMKLGGRLDGHLVLGHVDGTATLEKLLGDRPGARTREARFSASEDVTRYVVAKGSVAVDGVSLTVIGVDNTGFSVGLIPMTLENCTLGQLRLGALVNIETDIVGKYLERLLAAGPTDQGSTRKITKTGGSDGLTFEEMYELGYR